MTRSGLVALSACAVLVAPARLLAQDKPTLSGSWSASALTEQWAIGDWGEACGPKPKGQGAGGGSVQIREQGGELSIVGAGRAFSTSECWEQMPGLSRTSHSASGGGRFWRTRCTTAANDPRRATIVTTLSATDTSISMVETGQYQFILSEQNCTASVTRSRSFSLVRREGDTPPAASATATPTASATAPPATVAKPEPTPPRSCSGTAGEPARLEVSPARKILRPGERFAFRARVVDGEGCPVASRVAWSVTPGPLAGAVTLEAGGVRVADDAAEGTVDLVATVAGKGVTVAVEIVSAARYDELLGARGMNDAGEADEAAVVVIATGTIGGKTSVAEDTARERRRLFLAIVGAVAAVLSLTGLVLWRRGRKGALLAARGNGSTAGELEVGGAPTSEPPAPAELPPTSSGAEATRAGKRGKICPTCGSRYGADAQFCGKDGTTLVLVN